MPALRICNHPGCRNLSTGPYCSEHGGSLKRKAQPRTERDRFLDSRAWRRMSAWKLQETPYCEDCAAMGVVTPAQDADHVIPRSERPDLALDPENLRSLCDSCHGRKTAKENSPTG